MMEKVHVYMCLHIASIKYNAGNKTRLFPSPFFISTGRFCIFAKVFRKDHVAACGTALRSATEENEINGYLAVPCSSRTTQRSSTAGWIKF